MVLTLWLVMVVELNGCTLTVGHSFFLLALPCVYLHPEKKELLASESTDGGQFSFTNADKGPLSDDPQQVETEVPSSLESIDDLTFQHSNQTNVRQVGKFQPRKNKLCQKKAKSVSFILPDGSNSGTLAESFSVNPSTRVMIENRPVDDPLSSSNTTSSDWNGGLQMDHGTMEYENSEEHGLPKVLEDVDTEPQYQDVLELEQQILEDRTNSENSGDAGANISTMTLRKRRRGKNNTDKFEDRSNDECDTDNYLPEMNDNQSDDRHGEEDMPKPKRAKRKSNKQTTEIEKPARSSKKVPEKCNSSIENSPKKKFSHATRRKRRQVNKVLLQTPEDELDPRQISIKDLIMLAEAKERISNKEAAAVGKLFSNQSTSSLSNNDDTLFEEDQELNYHGEEGDHNVQQAPKKLNYHSYMNRPPTSRWSKSETALLYEAIHQFGSDFAMIQQLFPNRTRHQIKLKFKIEERKHPLQVHDALLHRSKDRSHVMQVIKQLRDKAEPTSNQEANGDPMNTLQDRVDKNEEETGGGSLNEELQQYDREGEDKDIKESMDSKGEVDDQDYNQDECVFEWDSGTYPQDVDEDTVWEI
ncbi:hypothetical protein Cni_G21307 [Canna indica]|uniref:SANT domain-containing protein n=1 Tax=Canna indica TaxID=4628 RepID=A0AAQ3QLJ9_9LILI|nr:hypothetical protein Cni_G21307 [Canna indica]